MKGRLLLLLWILSLSSFSLSCSKETNMESTSPFSLALQTLQQQLGYNFKTVNLLRRAMTHPSFSGENNRALSILGLYAIETSISLHCLERNIEMSPKELSRKVKEISEVGTCAIDGTRLGLDKIVRVSTKTNSTVPSVVCGAFRAVFGAIGVDAGNADDAGEVFWNVNHHGCGGGGASAM